MVERNRVKSKDNKDKKAPQAEEKKSVVNVGTLDVELNLQRGDTEEELMRNY